MIPQMPSGMEFGMQLGLQNPICGGKSEYFGDSNATLPVSEHIIKFNYSKKGYNLSLTEKGHGIYQFVANGGNTDFGRDGSKFAVSYECNDDRLLKRLLLIIKQQELYKNNHYYCEVGGLPAGLGDSLFIEYDSGETISRYSNQMCQLSDSQAKAVYDAFREDAVRRGFDFNTEGSNQVLYDDATEEYLQGTWKGKWFGREIVAEFSKSHVTISFDGEITDDTDYVIFEGRVTPDRIKVEKLSNGKPWYDNFNCDCTGLYKKNDFTISGSMYKDGSTSNFELFNFDKRGK